MKHFTTTSLIPWYWPEWSSDNTSFSSYVGNSLKYSTRDTENKHIIEVDLPGYTKDEVVVSYEGKLLTIKAENKSRGSSSLSLQLEGRGLSSKGVTAHLENGVLSVTFTRDPPESTLIKVT